MHQNLSECKPELLGTANGGPLRPDLGDFPVSERSEVFRPETPDCVSDVHRIEPDDNGEPLQRVRFGGNGRKLPAGQIKPDPKNLSIKTKANCAARRVAID
jgi:hypothetical protein